MYWSNLPEFLAMGDHGFYIWGSFVVMMFLMVLEPALLVRERRKLITRLRRQFQAEKRFGGSESGEGGH